MSLTCTRCDGTGFLNTHQIPNKELYTLDSPDAFLCWMEHNQDNDVQICDCCGDGDNWHGVPGEHYNSEDPQGAYGPYTYNGGLCECH